MSANVTGSPLKIAWRPTREEDPTVDAERSRTEFAPLARTPAPAAAAAARTDLRASISSNEVGKRRSRPPCRPGRVRPFTAPIVLAPAGRPAEPDPTPSKLETTTAIGGKCQRVERPSRQRQPATPPAPAPPAAEGMGGLLQWYPPSTRWRSVVAWLHGDDCTCGKEIHREWCSKRATRQILKTRMRELSTHRALLDAEREVARCALRTTRG